MSPVLNFTTPFPTASKEPFKFIVYGDMGVSTFPRADQTAKLILNEYHNHDIKFIFHNGDISYAEGRVSAFSELKIKSPLLVFCQHLIAESC